MRNEIKRAIDTNLAGLQLTDRDVQVLRAEVREETVGEIGFKE